MAGRPTWPQLVQDRGDLRRAASRFLDRASRSNPPDAHQRRGPGVAAARRGTILILLSPTIPLGQGPGMGRSGFFVLQHGRRLHPVPISAPAARRRSRRRPAPPLCGDEPAPRINLHLVVPPSASFSFFRPSAAKQNGDRPHVTPARRRAPTLQIPAAILDPASRAAPWPGPATAANCRPGASPQRQPVDIGARLARHCGPRPERYWQPPCWA